MSAESRPQPDAVVGTTEELQFRITAAMVGEFAGLISDYSSLHTDKAFGRRSMYRQNASHGMLPVLFLSCLQMLNKHSKRISFRHLSGKFLKPIFPGDTLALFSKIIDIDMRENQLELEYSIKHINSAIVVTTGTFLLYVNNNLSENNANFQNQFVSPGDIDIISPLQQNTLHFDEISKGYERQFDFSLSYNSAARLFTILREGLSEDYELDFRAWNLNSSPADLLGLSLLSTFVGMCIPGKYATFLDFSANFERTMEWERKYTIKGCVEFKSISTNTVIEKTKIYNNTNEQDVYISGRLNTLVNPPPVEMPSLGVLKESAADLQLDGKVILITGGSRGIGETVAKLLSLYGASVVINYLTGIDQANNIVKEITNDGKEAFSIRADVSDRDQVKSMIKTIHEKYGTIHVLINNAVRDAIPIEFLSLQWDDCQRDIDVIVRGAFNCCQEVIPMMLKNGGGKIINISTVYTDAPVPYQTKYILAKSALVGLTRALAVEFAGHNIQINLVAPSLVHTDLTSHISKVFLKSSENEMPMRRHATAVDVARTVVFLASSLASFTTGQKMMVTGGSVPFL